MITTGTRVPSRYWWVLALRGLAAVLFGLIALIFPGIALLALVYIFAAYVLVDGITALVVALQERGRTSHWVALLVEGIVSLIIGVMAFVWPGITALVLLYLVAIWAILTGIMEISAAFMIRLPVSQEWALGSWRSLYCLWDHSLCTAWGRTFDDSLAGWDLCNRVRGAADCARFPVQVIELR